MTEQWSEWKRFDRSDHNPDSSQFWEVIQISFPGGVTKRDRLTCMNNCPTCGRRTEKDVTVMNDSRFTESHKMTWYEKCRICGSGWKIEREVTR